MSLTLLVIIESIADPAFHIESVPLVYIPVSYTHLVGGIMFARKVFWALENVLLKSGIVAEKIIQKENHVLSVDDLEQALELTDKEDIKDEQNMLKGIIRFGDETAKEVMTTRQNIVDLDIRSTYPEVLKCIVENNYSRIPVYQDNTDNIRGVLYIKMCIRDRVHGDEAVNSGNAKQVGNQFGTDADTWLVLTVLTSPTEVRHNSDDVAS